MKKLFAMLLAAMMLLSLAACGGEPDTQEPENPETPAAEGTKLETSLWTLIYDDAVWSYEEDDLYDEEDYAELTLEIADGDTYIVSVEICASIEDAEDFRDDLVDYEFDQYEYAVNNSYDLVSVGGVDCLQYEGEYFYEPYVRYFGRVEGASATVSVEISGECDDARVETLLAGLSFALEDIGNEDFPWAWDGEPFSAEDASVSVGGFTLNSQWLPLGNGVTTNETFDHFVAASGNRVYILTDGTLQYYELTDSALVFDDAKELEEEYGSINACSDGSLWLAGFMAPMVKLENGSQTGSFEDLDEVAMAPSGTWGISWFSGPECEKLVFNGNSVSKTAITFPEVDTISTLLVEEDCIYVCGYSADESGHKVYVYDPNGTLLLTLADENGEGLGSVTFVTKTENGYLGFDGNMRDVILWTLDGEYIGDASDGDLFSTGYPWFCSAVKLSDGSILAIMTDDRADSSAMELVAFRLSGF